MPFALHDSRRRRSLIFVVGRHERLTTISRFTDCAIERADFIFDHLVCVGIRISRHESRVEGRRLCCAVVDDAVVGFDSTERVSCRPVVGPSAAS